MLGQDQSFDWDFSPNTPFRHTEDVLEGFLFSPFRTVAALSTIC